MTARKKSRSGARLILVSAPSGAGKTTLVKAMLDRDETVRFSVSYTTRLKRPSEREGIDYFFVSASEFEAMVQRDAFLEHATVFDHRYGTGRAHVEALIDEGFSVLLEIDWQGARQVRERVVDAISVFILPPSRRELELRLRQRASDSDAVIDRRLRDSLNDMAHWEEFDFVIINDDLERAVDEFAGIVGGDTMSSTADPAVRARVLAVIAQD